MSGLMLVTTCFCLCPATKGTNFSTIWCLAFHSNLSHKISSLFIFISFSLHFRYFLYFEQIEFFSNSFSDGSERIMRWVIQYRVTSLPQRDLFLKKDICLKFQRKWIRINMMYNCYGCCVVKLSKFLMFLFGYTHFGDSLSEKSIISNFFDCVKSYGSHHCRKRSDSQQIMSCPTPQLGR